MPSAQKPAGAEDAERALSRDQPVAADAAAPTPANQGSASAAGAEFTDEDLQQDPPGNGDLLPVPHLAHGIVSTQEECCGACKLVKGCVASGFNPASAMRPSWDGSINGGECFLSDMDNARPHSSQTICKPY